MPNERESAGIDRMDWLTLFNRLLSPLGIQCSHLLVDPRDKQSGARGTRDRPGGGWNGHVIVRAAGFVIDPSFDQALPDRRRDAEGVKLPEDVRGSRRYWTTIRRSRRSMTRSSIQASSTSQRGKQITFSRQSAKFIEATEATRGTRSASSRRSGAVLVRRTHFSATGTIGANIERFR
jgi:hypothetical protein